MKFAHEFKEALQREGFPSRWVESAIPYSQLKKCIKKVENELRSFGLDAQTLALLIPHGEESRTNDNQRAGLESSLAFQYSFAESLNRFRPKLTLYVQVADGVAVDATLSPDTRKFLGELAAAKSRRASIEADSDGLENEKSSVVIGSTKPALSHAKHDEELNLDLAASDIQQIEVPLTFDTEFFGLLKDDVSLLDALQTDEQKAMTDEITVLGNQIAKIAIPAKSNKTDLDRWREIFDIYLQAGVFFSTHELDHGSRNSATALRQLQWFQSEIQKRDLPRSFKLVKSKETLEKFTRINLTLLQNLKFQEINRMAITKILKKFDKRTSLGARETFPRLIQSEALMTEQMAKAVCAGVSNEIIKVVPQLDDYRCPVCFTISYKPVRLSCNHVFCIRCMIEMQKANSKYCPLCRGDVVMTADSANVDKALSNFLKKYFPTETKIKQRENEIAAGIDMYGEDFANAKCLVM